MSRVHDVFLDHDDPDRLIFPAERRKPPLGCLGLLLAAVAVCSLSLALTLAILTAAT